VRILIAPDKLRGTYTASEAAAALARGWMSVREADELVTVGLADGGEGTAEALLNARGGAWREAMVPDARGRPCAARWAELPDGDAAVDVSEAVGLWRIADLEADAIGASSYGAGMLLRQAIESGARRVIVGVGGTATTDGGAGLREALGAIPATVEVIAALDVDNPLLGPNGAALVYGPQKGATPQDIEVLEHRLEALALPTAALPGAGAGGGIGAMLMALGAVARPGAQLVLDEVGFDRCLHGSGLCITAEGRIDRQTLHGKAVAAVVERCAATGVPVAAVGGRIEIADGDLRATLLEEGDLDRAGAELARRFTDGRLNGG
jgi:glycerate 2-kinase